MPASRHGPIKGNLSLIPFNHVVIPAGAARSVPGMRWRNRHRDAGPGGQGMRIEKPARDPAFERRCREELDNFVHGRLEQPGRPCGTCAKPCGRHKSPVCQCECTPDCAHAPRNLSSEPEQFPIEAGIVPLVLALARLDGLDPFWSCQGHCGSHAHLNRLPCVSFQASSVMLPQMIARYLSDLEIAGRLSCSWQVRVVSWGDSVGGAHSIEPRHGLDDLSDLGLLRRDIAAIAADLTPGVKKAAVGFAAAE